MGARGKKRRRNDGSVASRKAAPRSASPRIYDDMDAVPLEVLVQAVAIENRYVPINYALHAAVGDGGWDDASEDALRDIDRLAKDRGLETDAVNIRVGKLAELLREPDREHLYSIADDGTVSIDAALLQHAATTHVDNSNVRLSWPI